MDREAVIAWDVVPEPDRYFRRQASVAAWAELPGKSFHAQCGSLQLGSIDTVVATLPPAWDLAERQLVHFIRHSEPLFVPFCTTHDYDQRNFPRPHRLSSGSSSCGVSALPADHSPALKILLSPTQSNSSPIFRIPVFL